MSNIRCNALGIIKHKNRVLVSKGKDIEKQQEFCRLFGGGIEFGERSREALVREMKEELGVDVTEVAFMRVIENIFTYNGEPFHEITFLYNCAFKDPQVYTFERFERIDKPGVFAEWVDLEDITSGKLILYPEKAVPFL